jgi:uncharacterized protein (TIGR00661 family)
MGSGKQKQVLVAVLDWGLGHATRCIPIIRGLISANCKVSVAGNGSSLELLKMEFPELMVHELPSYGITYPSHGFFFLHLFFLSPRVFKAIVAEKKEVEKLIRIHRFDVIISDNRYGCYSERVWSVLITHQLNIQLPLSLIWSKRLVNFINHRLIKKFDVCWVPDFPDARFSGKLSRASYLDVKWIGVLSRFASNEIVAEDKLLVGIVSGPEPQREIFEKILIKEFKKTNQPCLLLRGLPQQENEIRDGNIIILNHALSHELEWIISKAEVIISRSGYSTIMDLMTLGKKRVIFVPTPGQTEQEYLAVEMDKRKIAIAVSQHNFDLSKTIRRLKDYHGFDASEHPVNLLDEAIQDLLRQI